jgi:hypothetical protein
METFMRIDDAPAAFTGILHAIDARDWKRVRNALDITQHIAGPFLVQASSDGVEGNRRIPQLAQNAIEGA